MSNYVAACKIEVQYVTTLCIIQSLQSNQTMMLSKEQMRLSTLIGSPKHLSCCFQCFLCAFQQTYFHSCLCWLDYLVIMYHSGYQFFEQPFLSLHLPVPLTNADSQCSPCWACNPDDLTWIQLAHRTEPETESNTFHTRLHCFTWNCLMSLQTRGHSCDCASVVVLLLLSLWSLLVVVWAFTCWCRDGWPSSASVDQTLISAHA